MDLTQKELTLSNKILVVEDDALSQFVIVEMCKELGFECLTADDGAEALDLIAQNATDIKLVLMDIHMPKVSGLDATGAIRSTSEDPPKNLPVIATNADSNWHDLQRCHEHGFNSVLPKPVCLSKLSETLHHFSA